MLEVGRDIHGISRPRRKRGECGTCGAKLFKTGLLKHVPLTVPGAVLNGRCLKCDPLDAAEAAERRRQDRTSDRKATDAAVLPPPPVGSGNTPSPRATTFAVPQVLNVDDDATIISAITIEHNFGSSEFYDDSPVFDDDDDDPVIPPLPLGRPRASNTLDDDRPFAPKRSSDVPPLPARRQASRSDLVTRSKRDISVQLGTLPEHDEPILPNKTNPRKPQRSQKSMTSGNTFYDLEDIELDLFQNSDSINFEESSEQLIVESKEPDADTDVRQKLHVLRTEHPDRLNQLSSLENSLWNTAGRTLFYEEEGLDVLACILWTSMTDKAVLTGVLKTVLALVAGQDVDGKQNDNFMDALLISLQTQQEDATIHELALQIFCCLSAMVSVNDGTLSGSVLCVWNALKAHRSAQPIQLWGLRALYNQCVYSSNAEPNKRTLLLQEGVNEFLVDVLNEYKPNSIIIEWSTKLIWLLSASADLACKLDSTIIDSLFGVLEKLNTNGQDQILAGIQEAVMGALANLVSLNHINYEASGAQVASIFRIARTHVLRLDIFRESCGLLGALLLNTRDVEDQMAVDLALFLLNNTEAANKSVDTLEVMLRSIVVLLQNSSKVSALLSEPEHFDTVFGLCQLQNHVTKIQEVGCALVASLFEVVHCTVENVSACVAFFCQMLKQSPESEKIHAASLLGLRNVCCSIGCQSLEATVVKSLACDALQKFPENSDISINACCLLWHLQMDADIGALDGESVSSIVRVLQRHLENADVVLMACGALWTNVVAAPLLKKSLLEIEGAIGSIACVLVMHPENEAVLEHSCGILTSLTTTNELASTVIESDVCPTLMEVLGSSQTPVSVLMTGVVFFRNICHAEHDFAEKLSGIIPNVLDAMRQHTDNTKFQREACGFLWVASCYSEETKSTIMSMDGVALLMATLENYNGIDVVEEVALGAFRELTLNAQH